MLNNKLFLLMDKLLEEYGGHVEEMIAAACSYTISSIKPSDWAEQNRVMTTEVSPFPGKFKFNRTPYLKEICDTASPEHPASKIAVIKGAQIGFSTGVIENVIGYIIAENPGPTLFLTGHSDLAEEAMNGKIDQMIDSCNLRPLIRPNVLRKKNQRTGDTSKSKEFPGGSLVAGSAGNHKLLRQRSVRFGFIDDYDAAKKSTKESGSTTEMIEQRFAAYYDIMKLYYISTPELKETSNIEPVYLLGDQRKYNVPCPKCGDYITLEWSIKVDGKVAGIHYELDENNKLIGGSVGYICQSCFQKFTDKYKYEMLLNGEWKPTAQPSEPGYYSYHLSSLYAPPGMYDWNHYVIQYLNANPPGGEQNPKKMQTFVNLVLGQTYEEKGDAPKAKFLQQNMMDYERGIIPRQLSRDQGNGEIVLITCACDLNGLVDDARLDYEIVAWSEAGPSYSVDHGSIGTFIPNQTRAQKDKTDRAKLTYNTGESNNVWTEFEKIVTNQYETDDGHKMFIGITGVDTGNTYLGNAYSFVESMSGKAQVFGIKGKDEFTQRRVGVDTPLFKKGRERSDLYIVEVNQVKDEIAQMMKLKWKQGSDSEQPYNFMNFPIPSGKAYTFNSYFSHFEAEHRILETDKAGEGVKFVWRKKNSAVQNHLFDCRIYNYALREIVFVNVSKELKIVSPSWKEYCDFVLGRRK